MVVYFATATNCRSRGVLWSIIAPPFISEFRAKIVRLNSLLSERAILGQFLRGASSELPDERNVEGFSRFRLEQVRIPIGMVNESLRSDLRPVVMATQRGTCFVWIAVPDGYFPTRRHIGRCGPRTDHCCPMRS